MHELHQHLINIIKDQQIRVLFQPIIALGPRRIFAYEALVRGPSDSPLHSPARLFGTAHRFQETTQLEQACRKACIEQFAAQGLTQKLFLNVSPSELTDSALNRDTTLACLKQAGLGVDRIVVEISEQQPTDEFQLIRNAVRHFRDLGFEVALNDLGTGYSGLRMWAELLPDYVKINRHFMQNINKDPVKRNFVRSIQTMAAAATCQVIGEGLETEGEFHVLEELGIPFAQGYYFARPSKKAVIDIPAALFRCRNNFALLPAIKMVTHISEIIDEVAPVSPQTPVSEVLKLFQKNSMLDVMPLVENGEPYGLIYKDQFLTKLFSIHENVDQFGGHAVLSFVDRAPLLFDHQESIEEVSQQLTHMSRSDAAFVLTENGRYRGIGTMMNLLQLITEQQIQNARHANPLTQLPGMTPVNQTLDSLMAQQTHFAVGYFDLDNLKPFNEFYGYTQGDQAIKLLAWLLKDCFADGSGMVGHLGGDDFIVIFTGRNWEKQCKQILQVFQQRIVDLYAKDHRLAGGIKSIDRQGKPHFFPFMSLSIGILESDAIMKCRTHMDIADLAAGAKHQAKMIAGNSYFINRRIPAIDALIKKDNSYLLKPEFDMVD